MPRSFTRKEKERIRTDLIEKGTSLFGRYGLKKTSIDEIVKAAGIAKGSFYKFFPTKEALYFTCLEIQELEMQEKYLKPIFAESGDPEDMFNRLFKFIFNLPDEFPLITTMQNRDEYAQLVSGLPEEVIEKHRINDRSEMSEFMIAWKEMGIEIDEDPGVINGLFQALAILNFHRDEIGKEVFHKTAGLLTRILSAGMISLYCPGGKND